MRARWPRALREGRIAGAALDVFGEEPLPAAHPFRGLLTLVARPYRGYVGADPENRARQPSRKAGRLHSRLPLPSWLWRCPTSFGFHRRACPDLAVAHHGTEGRSHGRHRVRLRLRAASAIVGSIADPRPFLRGMAPVYPGDVAIDGDLMTLERALERERRPEMLREHVFAGLDTTGTGGSRSIRLVVPSVAEHEVASQAAACRVL